MFPKIGLVFNGGGAKGAYQIGVWKAMRETGIDRYVTAVSGASVGGLNACLFVQGDYEKAEYIWTNKSDNIKLIGMSKTVREMIENYIDFSVFSYSKIDCFIAAVRSSNSHSSFSSCTSSYDNRIEKIEDGQMTYFNLRSISIQERKDFVLDWALSTKVLLATSAIPILCKPQTIDGEIYYDGGLRDNCPVYPLNWNSALCDTIIAIHLKHTKDRIDKSQYPEVKIHEIVPNVSSDELGLLKGTLHFNTEHAKKLLQAGYNDSIDVFRKMDILYNMEDNSQKRKKRLQQIDKEDSEYLHKMEKLILG